MTLREYIENLRDGDERAIDALLAAVDAIDNPDYWDDYSGTSVSQDRVKEAIAKALDYHA